MASFASNPSQFNPYISQLPIVEEMSKVGMEKQAKYDQGIQKIQTQIDNVAGMDVMRDVDKKYLQSKMGELGNNLKYVAAGDFSNYQLTNSVGGMVNQIGKDEDIQNAVYSTMKYRKGASDMAAANKAGKGSPSNDWDFNDKANKWMNGDIKASFSASYDPYTNYKKNALEVIKSLTKDESITDSAFSTDKNGNLVINDAMVRTKLAGISPEKIQEALMANLTPADFKQMQTDGRYTYSNVDNQSFANQIRASHEQNVQFYMQQRAVLDNAKLSTTSNPERDKLDAQIASLDKTLANINSEYSNTAQRFAMGDYESAKAQLHTSNFMNNFSKAFSYTQTSQEHVSSPYVQAQQFRETKAQDWKKFSLQYEQDDRQFGMRYALDVEELGTKKEANALKKKEIGGYGGVPYTVSQSDLPEVSLAKVVASTEADTKAVGDADYSFMKQNGKDQQWLDQQRTAWLKSPSAVDPMIAQHFNGTEQKRRDIDSNIAMVTEINKKATAEYGDIYSKIPTDASAVRINGITYTPREIVDHNNQMENYATWMDSPSAESGKMIFDDVTAKKELTPKEYRLYEIDKKQTLGIPLNNDEKVVLNAIIDMSKSVNIPYRKVIEKINDFTAKEVKDRMMLSQAVSYDIPTGNAVQRGSISTVLLSFANKAQNLGGKLAESPNFNEADARVIATAPDSRYTISVVEGTEITPAMYAVTATGKGKTVQFKITPEEKMSVFGNMFEASPEVQAIRPYQSQIRKMGGYSTGTEQGPTTVANSYLRNLDFPQAKVYGVTGNIITPDGGNSYSIRLNLRDPLTGKTFENIPYPPSGMIGEEQIAKAMAGLNDAAIFQMITGKDPDANDLSNAKNASKNPLK